jgi:hypothetical protein
VVGRRQALGGAAALLLALAVAAPAALAQTVTDYLRDPAARERQIGRCMDDEAECRRARSANAARAADLAARHRRREEARRRIRTPGETLADPGYYRANPLAAVGAMAECRSGVWHTVTAADCAAAAAALR